MSITSNPKIQRTIVSLFAGCGGSSLGYKQAGFDVRLAVEWDSGAADVYRRNFPDTNIFVGDIADLTSDEALKITDMNVGDLDIMDGSPPCQGFSTMGLRKFTDSRNRLFEQYLRMLNVFRPKALIMENVSGLRKGKMKLMFAEMTTALKNAGYKISCRELNAWWYGVPQDRRRLIWVGIREDIDAEPSHPQPIVAKPISVSIALGRSVRWRTRGGYYRPSRTPSPTLTAGRRPTVFDHQQRAATTEECRILQGFPDSFEIKEREYKYIGNSVCPPMAEAVGRHVAELIEGRKAELVENE